MFLNKKLLLLCKSFIPLFLTLMVILNSCGIYKKADARKIPAGADARVAKNIEEGKGMVTGKDLFGSSSTNYEFATSNELWRAALSVLDFLPLSNVDYSGGIIITDWYNEGTSNDESIKITVRFLTTEIRSDAVEILIHKKICNMDNNCKVAKISSDSLEEEIKLAILREATLLAKDMKTKTKKSFKKKYGKSLPQRKIEDRVD